MAIVDSDMQHKVIRVKLEFLELVHRDEQVERHSLIAHIEAERFWEELVWEGRYCELSQSSFPASRFFEVE